MEDEVQHFKLGKMMVSMLNLVRHFAFFFANIFVYLFAPVFTNVFGNDFVAGQTQVTRSATLLYGININRIKSTIVRKVAV